MKITIIGTGEVGRVLAVKLKQEGHSICFGTRNVENTMAHAEAVGYASEPWKDWYARNNSMGLKTFAEAAAEGDLIMNCTGGLVSIAALEAAGEENLNGKVIIDVANPLDFSHGMPPRLNPVNDDSLGEQIQRRFPGAKVVKALNTVNVAIMVNPGMLAGDHNLFICGDHDDAKEVCLSLLEDLGWRRDQVIDMGGIISARGTEMMLPFWIQLMGTLGTAEFNFYLQRKK